MLGLHYINKRFGIYDQKNGHNSFLARKNEFFFLIAISYVSRITIPAILILTYKGFFHSNILSSLQIIGLQSAFSGVLFSLSHSPKIIVFASQSVDSIVYSAIFNAFYFLVFWMVGNQINDMQISTENDSQYPDNLNKSNELS